MARYQKKNQMVGLTFDIDLDMSGLQQVIKAAKQAHTKHVRFGWINGKNHPFETGKRLPIAQIAAWQEFGTRANGKAMFKGGNGEGIPARKPLTITYYVVSEKILGEVKDYFIEVCKGSYSDKHLEAINKKVVKVFKETIDTQMFIPQLSGFTVKIKGHSYIFKDTGILINNFESKTFKTNYNKIRVGA